jgi:site-specific DNA-methyltransferase (adenine-specific)
MQRRVRDERGKTIYDRNEEGAVISNGVKRGVPLSDVWEIPYLNPKAKERTGYPTQKPVLLLEKIIEIVTSPGDGVLDPFCGSGTTLVAAKLLGREFIGIDISKDATTLAKERLAQPFRTESKLLEAGKESYDNHDRAAAQVMGDIEYVPVHRNKGIDGVLKASADGMPVFIRVQRDDESLADAVGALRKAAKNKGGCKLVLICTKADMLLNEGFMEGIALVPSLKECIAGIMAGRDSSWMTIN